MRSRWPVFIAAAAALAVSYPRADLPIPRQVGEQSSHRGNARSAAYDGGFLTVWDDGRESPLLLKAYGTRITLAGAVLDPAGLGISTLRFVQHDPVASCVGTRCFVAWRNGPIGLVVAPFDAATGGRGPSTELLPLPGNLRAHAALANNGNSLLAVMTDSTRISARFVDINGSLSAPFTVAVANGTSRNFVSVVYGNGAYLVSWTEGASAGLRLFAQVVNAASGALVGLPLDCGPSVNEGAPAIATDGVDFIIVRAPGTGTVNAREIDVNGNFVSGTELIIGAAISADWPAVAFDGSGYAIVWARDGFNLVVVRVSANLNAVSPITVLLTDRYRIARLGLTLQGARGLLTWEQDRFPLESWLTSTLLSLNATPAVLDAGYASQRTDDALEKLRATWHGDHFEVGFTAYRDFTGRAMSSTSSATNAPALTPVALGASSDALAGVEVASGGTVFHRAWSDGKQVLWQLDGGAPVALTMGNISVTRPAIAARGDRAGFAFAIGGPSGGAVQFREWTAATGLLPLNALAMSPAPTDVAITMGPDGYLVSYTSSETGFVQSIPFGGAISSRTPRIFSGAVYRHAIAAGPDDALVVWSSYGSDLVFSQRFAFDGGPLAAPVVLGNGDLGLVNGLRESTAPDVAFDGLAWHVAWASTARDGGAGIRTRDVLLDGGLTDGHAVIDGAGEPEQVAVAVGTPGRVLYGWREWDSASRSAHLYTVVEANVPMFAPCFGPSECRDQVAFCVAGFCCPTPSVCRGMIDAGELSNDAGPADAGPADAGPADAGAVDAGPADAGAVDAGDGDAGAEPFDAGTDGGMTGPEDPRVLSVHCGCALTDSGPALLLLLIAAQRLRRLASPISHTRARGAGMR